MGKLSQDQSNFLQQHNVPLDKVFDATGLPASVYKERMKAGGYWIAFGVSPCNEAGHRLRTRHSQCIQCNPKQLSFIKRHYKFGLVYIAFSPSKWLVKIGTSQSSGRVDQLNTYRYGGAHDWRDIQTFECENAGKVETTAHTTLTSFMVKGLSYFKEGRHIGCDELFSCSIDQAINAVKCAIHGIKPEKTSTSTRSLEIESNQISEETDRCDIAKKSNTNSKNLIINDLVMHPKKSDWGIGKILEIRDGKLVVIGFEFAGTKVLSLEHVELHKIGQ